MIDCSVFFKALETRGVRFFTGVPDSLLADLCAYITDNVPEEQHIIASNEGGAVSLCAGHYLATGEMGCCYMQNSGLGNAANPLISLSDPLVYGIPLLLLIGWRGEPGVKDEPQHAKQGLITLEFLQTLGIPYTVLDENTENIDLLIDKALQEANKTSAPYALVVKKNTFAPYKLQNKQKTTYPLEREEAIGIVLEVLGRQIIVSTTGKISRELYEWRDARGQRHDSDFLTVGSMGHSSQIALAIAMAKPESPVFCFDGDGASLMHLGHLAINGSLKRNNFFHLIFNNQSHDSVGGQPTVAGKIDFPGMARAAGYGYVKSASTREEIKKALEEAREKGGPAFIEIKVKPGARADLGRPKISPEDQKERFMDFLQGGKI